LRSIDRRGRETRAEHRAARPCEDLPESSDMSEYHLRVHNLPQEVNERELAGSTVIVIDVLRATSTIVTALANGAREVVPFLEIEDALAAVQAANGEGVVLGGERRGGKIAGFDVGNSPSEYTRDAVEGKRVFITTTNGTKAMHHARLAKRVVLGSFLNLSAVAASVKDEPRIDILCAGTDGKQTMEDFYTAGAIVYGLCKPRQSRETKLNEMAQAAKDEWELSIFHAKHVGQDLVEHLADNLRSTEGGRNLIGIGLDQDIVDCAQIDRFDTVPELDIDKWQITAHEA
jgi:2-phosphosulfolactate phosphatase